VPSELLTGLSFTDYPFRVVDPQGAWNPVAGLYAFCLPRTALRNSLVPVYIGETSSFAARMPGHDDWKAAQRLGATVMLARVFNGTERRRKDAEADLILAYRPVLNMQHNTTNALAGLAGVRAGFL
jgi:hypothetical protein